MSLPKKIHIEQNGYHSASPNLGGAFVSATGEGIPANWQKAVARNRTVFPEDPPLWSARTVLYGLTKSTLMGIPLFRWALFVWIVIVLGTLVSGLISWQVALGLVVLIPLIASLSQRYLASQDYLRFEEETQPQIAGQSLESTEKIPVHVTGLFSVEGKTQRFTWLSGFYRTFPTREHALLCMARARTFWHIGLFNPDDVGMWYIFFQPTDISKLRWGTLYFGSEPRPCIVITRQFMIPAKRPLGREKVAEEQVFVAFLNEEERERIWADLLVDAQLS